MNYFKSFLLTVSVALFTLAACDTDDLRNDVDDLKGRVESLEAQVHLLNDNMTAIKRLLEGGQTITDVKNSNGAYTLTLSDGSTVTLTQGSKGEVKYPEITVNDEGQWVVNGEVLKDASGNPVSATGEAGATPKFRIESEKSYWQVSYDNGSTWTNVLDESGNPVSAVGDGSSSDSANDTFFESAEVDESGDFFVVKLKDREEAIRIPIVKDLLCEIEAPAEGMNNGYWEIGYGQTATTTVKVKGDNVMVTAPAGWTATIGEADENNVATLSVTAPAASTAASLTRATADNSSDVTVQVNTGANWAVAKIQVKAIAMVESYYALYEAGETLTISGVNVNKETFGEATLITEDNYDLAPTADGGIYFIKEGITVNFTSDANIDHLVLIGDNSHKISRIHVEKQIKLLLQAEGNGHFLCKNIALDASDFSNQIFTVNSNGVYPYVAFDQCEIIPAPTKHLLYLSSAERSIDNFIIENSKFIVPTGTGENQKFLISAGSSTATYNHITIRNNVFYCQEGSIRTFAVIQGSQTTIGDITIDNNTFVNVHPATTSVVYTQEISNSVNISNNLFYMDVNEANNCIIVRATKNKDDGSGYPANGTCENNIVKRQDSSRNWQMFYGGKRPSFLTGEPLTIISANPFEGGTFDLENGIFVPNAEYAQYGASIN